MRIWQAAATAVMVWAWVALAACGGKEVRTDAEPTATTGAETPEALADAVSAAVAQPDYAVMQALCSPRFSAAEGADSCAGLHGQAQAKGFGFRRVEVMTRPESKDTRAVVLVDVTRAEQAVDRIFLYAVAEDGRWYVDDVNENEPRTLQFLGGQ